MNHKLAHDPSQTWSTRFFEASSTPSLPCLAACYWNKQQLALLAPPKQPRTRSPCGTSRQAVPVSFQQCRRPAGRCRNTAIRGGSDRWQRKVVQSELYGGFRAQDSCTLCQTLVHTALVPCCRQPLWVQLVQFVTAIWQALLTIARTLFGRLTPPKAASLAEARSEVSASLELKAGLASRTIVNSSAGQKQSQSWLLLQEAWLMQWLHAFGDWVIFQPQQIPISLPMLTYSNRQLFGSRRLLESNA